MAPQHEREHLDPQMWLGACVQVVIDRPMGSRHPRFGFPYPINYGFIPGTLAPDGCELDAYVLGPAGPCTSVRGEVVGVIRRADDVEDKLVVATGGWWDPCTIIDAVAFTERWFASTLHTAEGAAPCGQHGRAGRR